MEKKKITETDYVMWLNEHFDEGCDANYEGSSGGMEAVAAMNMWQRSLHYNIRYETFVSAGDSAAFLAVCALNGGKGPYGERCRVEKMECVNHVAKRLGTAMRGLKKVKRIGKQKKIIIWGEKQVDRCCHRPFATVLPSISGP